MTKLNPEFNTNPPSLEEGVIVGATHTQEWLLPWWWMHFRAQNTYPVTFFDFGDLSPTAIEWCKRRGQVVKLESPELIIASKELVDPEKVQDWESMNPKVWESRSTWFKKPLAMVSSPYKKTIWLDLDCQVRGSLAPLFELDLNEGGIGCVPENLEHQKLNFLKGRMLPGQLMYNSGVIVFNNESKIIREWAKQSLELNQLFYSEQQLLVHVLFTQKVPFLALPHEYNWTIDDGIESKAVIIHFWSGKGKEILKKHIDLMNSQMGYNMTFDDKTSLVGQTALRKF